MEQGCQHRCSTHCPLSSQPRDLSLKELTQSDRLRGGGALAPDLLPGNTGMSPPQVAEHYQLGVGSALLVWGRVTTMGCLPRDIPTATCLSRALKTGVRGVRRAPLPHQWASLGALTPTPHLVRQPPSSRFICQDTLTQTALLPGELEP